MILSSVQVWCRCRGGSNHHIAVFGGCGESRKDTSYDSSVPHHFKFQNLSHRSTHTSCRQHDDAWAIAQIGMGLTQQPSNGDPDLACAERRRSIARQVYSIWTDGGSDYSKIAPAFLDGRVDALSLYITLADQDDDEEEDDANKEEQFAGASSFLIEVCRSSELSYEEFFSRYMLPNRPVIIQGLAVGWKATTSWTMPSSGGKQMRMVPNLEYLERTFGSCVAPVHVQSRPGFTPTRPIKQEMTMAEYADWWKNHHRDIANDAPIWYLKDWKFVAAYPKYDAYEWPHFFQDDWLNGAMGHAYKFVYLGPKGSCTRLHADVLMSYSWSTNVCGRKQWYLVPPQYSYLLYDCFGESLACHLHADIECGDSVFFPGLTKARKYAIEVIQEAGETIFVPSKWFHNVENLEPTLSINHNWLNGTNLHCSWDKVQSEIQNLQFSDPQSQAEEPNQSNGNHNDTSQVGDDLLTIWLVISKKAHEIMGRQNEIQDLASTTQGPLNGIDEFNLREILRVLRGIQSMIKEGKEQGLLARCDCNVDSLAWEVQESIERIAAKSVNI